MLYSRLLLPCIALFTVITAHSQETLSPPNWSTNTMSAVASYGAAWASRDARKITALHADETEFVLHVGSVSPFIGKREVFAQFEQILKDIPDYASEIKNLRIGPNFAVIEYVILTSPSQRFRLGNLTFEPKSDNYVIPAIDVIDFKDGLVTSKHTYIDTETIRPLARNVSGTKDS